MGTERRFATNARMDTSVSPLVALQGADRAQGCSARRFLRPQPRPRPRPLPLPLPLPLPRLLLPLLPRLCLPASLRPRPHAPLRLLPATGQPPRPHQPHARIPPRHTITRVARARQGHRRRASRWASSSASSSLLAVSWLASSANEARQSLPWSTNVGNCTTRRIMIRAISTLLLGRARRFTWKTTS